MPHTDQYKELRLKQKHYTTLVIDNAESDVIQLWQHYPKRKEGDKAEVIMIERENLKQFIEMLELL